MEVIEINDKIAEQVMSIKEGHCFIYKRHSYMVTDRKEEPDIYCVCLETGKQKAFNKMDKVIPKLGKTELRDLII